MNKADPAKIVSGIFFLSLGLLALSMSGVDQPPMPPRVSEIAVEANDWCDKCEHHVCHATVEGHTSGTVCGVKLTYLTCGKGHHWIRAENETVGVPVTPQAKEYRMPELPKHFPLNVKPNQP